MNLKKAVYDRTQTILKQAVVFEDANRTSLLNQIVDEALKALDSAMKGPKIKEIEQKMFDSALEGLSKGVMEYNNDPILPLVMTVVKEKAASFQKLSKEEQIKLISLTNNQLASIRAADQKAKADYLNDKPRAIENSLKNNEYVKKSFENWGTA